MTFNFDTTDDTCTLRVYKCKINLRKTFNGNELKPEAIALDGMILDLQILWKMDKYDSYPGEYALGLPHNSDPSINTLIDIGGIAWIASGDVEVLKEIT